MRSGGARSALYVRSLQSEAGRHDLAVQLPWLAAHQHANKSPPWAYRCLARAWQVQQHAKQQAHQHVGKSGEVVHLAQVGLRVAPQQSTQRESCGHHPRHAHVGQQHELLHQLVGGALHCRAAGSRLQRECVPGSMKAPEQHTGLPIWALGTQLSAPCL